DVWAVTVTPNDGRMDGPSSTASVTISNTPPVVTSLRLTPLHPRTNDVLHAEATASDVDGTPVTFTYKWTRDGVLVSPPNGPDVAASLTTKGQVWNVTVTPDDGTDAGAPVTASVTVENTPPVLDSLVARPDAPRTDDALHAVASASDADGDAVTIDYAWTRNGADANVSVGQVDPAATARGDVWQVT